MQPQYLSMSAIFGPQVRYTVPLFQRPYVWSRADQWEPLWDDLQALADRVLTAPAKTPVAGHFLGTAVLEQADNPTGTLPRREIIDGQQRLTTLQIILKAAEHALEAARDAAFEEDERRVCDVAARQIGALTSNPAYGDPDEKYKVWPTNLDRPAYQGVVDSSRTEADTLAPSRMSEAYRYFRTCFGDWLTRSSNRGQRAAALAGALKDHLRLIVLDLDENDEPQAIFETLNAHGTPLLPADLIKNWFIWEATKQELPATALYDANWRPFDDDPQYWRSVVGTGHAARARIDTFLQNWLTRRTRKPVPPKHLYDHFLRHVGARPHGVNAPPADVPALMQDIAADAVQFRHIDQATGKTRFETFLKRLKVFDIGVFQPVLMALMRRPGSDSGDLDRIGECFESWLLRRVICGGDTRGYSTFAISLLEVLAELPADEPAARAFAAHLISDKGLGFPTDDQFRSAWMSKPFYGYFRRDRVVTILRAIEESLMGASRLGEPILAFNFDALQVEHILPQQWEEHWPLPAGLERTERDSRVHRIGNLTLVSKKLNPSLSNAAWADRTVNGKMHQGKRSGLNDHSALRLNSRIVTSHPETWDEACIDARSAELFEIACQLWPRPRAQQPSAAPSVAPKELERAEPA